MVQNLSQIVNKYDYTSKELKSLVDIFRSINQASLGQQPIQRPGIQKSVSPPKSASKVIDGFIKKAEESSVYANQTNIPQNLKSQPQRHLRDSNPYIQDNQMSFSQL